MLGEAVFAGLDPVVALALYGASFVASLITVAFGIGGGALLLAVMASFLPPAALIPVHGVVQFGSNGFRALLLIGYTHWPPVAAFTIGSVFGVALGGVFVVNLPPGVVLIGIGLFVIWNVLTGPPPWLSAAPLPIGAISSFLTMFFGATGIFVANFTKSLALSRQPHVATHAVLMVVQHGLKMVAFGLFGFAFGPWWAFIALMIAAGFLGTVAGRRILVRGTDKGFKRALDIILVLISLRLIWQGTASLLAPS